jgi:hypothetical protein
MSDLEILREMIKDSARVEVAAGYDNKKQVVLTESQQADSSVIVFGLPEDTIVIKADAFVSPSFIFNGSQGECKRADFIIVASSEITKTIIFIEMKVGKGEAEAEIIMQLKGAKCFFSYCQEIGRSFWNEPSFLQGYNFRFVSIRESSIAKRPTRPDRQTAIHDQPERMLKLLGNRSLQFKMLAGVNR